MSFKINYSIGSQLTKPLIAFRDLKGSEENWPNSAKTKPGYSFYMRATIAEVGFALIPMVAVIELVVYGWIFLPYSLGVYFLSNKSNEKPIYSTVELVASVQNTLVWNIHNLYHNLIAYDFSTCEPDISGMQQRSSDLQKLRLYANDLNHFTELEKDGNVPSNRKDFYDIGSFLAQSFTSFQLLHSVLEKPSNLALKIDILTIAEITKKML